MILDKIIPKHIPIKYCICKWHVMSQINTMPIETSFIKKLISDDDDATITYFKNLFNEFSITLNIDQDNFMFMKRHFIDVNKHIIDENNILEPNIKDNSMLDASITLQKLKPILNDKSYADDKAFYTINLQIEDTQKVIPLNLYKYDLNIPSLGNAYVVPSWLNIDSTEASYVLAEPTLLDKLLILEKGISEVAQLNENFMQASEFVKSVLDTYKSCHIISSQILTLLNYINSAIKTIKG